MQRLTLSTLLVTLCLLVYTATAKVASTVATGARTNASVSGNALRGNGPPRMLMKVKKGKALLQSSLLC